MRWIRLDPPGELCQIQAVCDALSRPPPRTFVEAGCGAGSLCRELCRRGLVGTGIDPSAQAIQLAAAACRGDVAAGRLRLLTGDLATVRPDLPAVDLAVSMMTVEHVADDLGFVRELVAATRPGGQVILGAPGRPDRWSIEDDLAGHLRRYDRQQLSELLRRAGVEEVRVRSASVPLANLLFAASSWLVRRASTPPELAREQRAKTLDSGIRSVPLKTVFPPPFALLLNRGALYPFFLLQRLFYDTGLGLTLIGSGRVAATAATPIGSRPPLQ